MMSQPRISTDYSRINLKIALNLNQMQNELERLPNHIIHALSATRNKRIL
ncbi:hypothetical protein SOVF_092360 [Spinacia oleracea]|nr:hypothetical protein SOVF_092360 [Spinacia oleracea]